MTMMRNFEGIGEESQDEMFSVDEITEANEILEQADECLERAMNCIQNGGSLSATDWYLQNIMHLKRLTKEKERQLIQTIQDGAKAEKKAKERTRSGVELDAESSTDLEEKTNKAKVAMDELVFNNQDLVYSIAKMAVSAMRGQKEEILMDCVQEGNIALMCAAKRYNAQFGCSFRTYAAYWISGCCKTCAALSLCTTTVPKRVCYDALSVLRTVQNLSVNTVSIMTYEEVSKMAKMPVERVRKAIIALHRAVNPMEASNHIPPLAEADIVDDSSYAKIDRGGEVPDPTQYIDNLINAMDKADVRKKLLEIVGTLPEMEGAVIKLRYRLDEKDTGRNRTMEEVSKLLGITVFAAKYNEQKAIWDMKQAGRLQKLCQAINMSTSDVLMKEAKRYGELYTDRAVKKNNLRIEAGSAVDIFRRRYNAISPS